jgi:hypothetical protein
MPILAQDVNNSSPGIGHNRLSLAQAAQANIETGVLLLCKEALVTAIQDRRLERGHLKVLAAIAMCINSRTAKAWPERSKVAERSGLSVRSVSNALLELRNWGYLVADKETVEEAGGRRLTVYTFGNIDHETIRREITEFVAQLRMQRDAEEEKSPPTVTSERHRGRCKSPPAVTNPSPPAVNSASPPTVNVTAHGGEKSPPTGDSYLKKELIDLSLSSSAQERAPDWTIEDGCFAGQAFELSEAEYDGLQRAYGNLEFPAELVTADAYLATQFAAFAGPISRDEKLSRLRLYLNSQNRKTGVLRRQAMGTAANKPRKPAAPMLGENAGSSVCWIDEAGFHLADEVRAEWLEKFDGNEERLNMAIKEIAPHVRTNSPTPLKVQIDGKLGKIVGEKLDKDTRYSKASKPEKGISRLKQKFLTAGE